MGRRDLRLSDRGPPPRRRGGAEHLAPLLPQPGSGGQRRYRRPGLRPLPPLRRGPGADGGAGPGRLPFQRRLGPGAAGGPRCRQSPGARLLPKAGGCPAGARYPAHGHPLPLGPAGRPARPRRLAQPGQSGLVCRLCAGPVPRPGRPGAPLGDPERALGRHSPGVSLGRAGPRPSGPVRSTPGRPPSAACACRGGRRLPVPGPPSDRPGGQPGAPAPRLVSPRGPGRRGPARRLRQPLVLGPAPARDLPDRASGPVRTRLAGGRGGSTWRASAPPPISSASTITPEALCGRTRRPGPWRQARCTCPA